MKLVRGSESESGRLNEDNEERNDDGGEDEEDDNEDDDHDDQDDKILENSLKICAKSSFCFIKNYVRGPVARARGAPSLR